MKNFYGIQMTSYNSPMTVKNYNHKHNIGEQKMKFGFTPEAEILNSRLAMLGFVIAVGTYMTTGQIIPGVW